MPPDNQAHPATENIDTHTCHLPNADVLRSVSSMDNPEIVRLAKSKKLTVKDGRLPRIYIASKTIHASKWTRLRDRGYNIISTWIDEIGEGQSDYQELSVRCIREIRQSDFLILYCEKDEVLKGANVEAGAALAFGLEVRCVGKCDTLNRVFCKHPLWHEYSDIYAALENK
jgi:hypothetical protein